MQKDETNKMTREADFVPALRFSWATSLYDAAIRLFTRENGLRCKTVELVQQTRPGRVLEAGCGTGSLTVALSKALPDIEIVGLDIDPDILSLAEAKTGRKENVTLLQGNLTDLQKVAGLPAGGFDTIVSSLVFHHLTTAQKRSAMANIAMAMNGDARLVLVDWGPPVGIVQSLGFWLVRLLDGFNVTQANRDGLMPSLLTQAGFKIEEVKPLHQTGLGTVWLYQVRRKQNTMALKGGTDD